MEQEITHYSCGKLHVGQITGTRIPDPLFPHLVPPAIIISLRLGFRRNFLSVLHPNLVSSPIKGILEILNLTPRCIPMDIWTYFGIVCFVVRDVDVKYYIII
jgi:hypothetical protein